MPPLVPSELSPCHLKDCAPSYFKKQHMHLKKIPMMIPKSLKYNNK